MYYHDHAPPHFHVRYGGQKALVAIDTLDMIAGEISPRALKMVLEWAKLHQSELKEDWLLAQQEATLKPIAPLE